MSSQESLLLASSSYIPSDQNSKNGLRLSQYKYSCKLFNRSSSEIQYSWIIYMHAVFCWACELMFTVNTTCRSVPERSRELVILFTQL